MSLSAAAAGGVDGEVQRRLMDMARELEGGRTVTARKKCLKDLVELLSESNSRFRQALDSNSAQTAASSSSSSSALLVDWSALLSLALTCVLQLEGVSSASRKARSTGPSEEAWRLLLSLLQASERHGRHLTPAMLDSLQQELMQLLHMDTDRHKEDSKDGFRIEGAIAPLSNILEIILSYQPYAQRLAQTHLQDLFALYSNVLVTLSHLPSADSTSAPPPLSALHKSLCHFPHCFLGLFRTPATATTILSKILQHYPFASAAATGAGGKKDAATLTHTFVAGHVFPFFLSLFSLRLPDHLLTRLLSSLNHMLERQVALSHLHLLRDFSYKFVYAMLQPGAWPKSATVKNELVRFCNLILRVSNQLPASNPLRIVQELDSAHPLYRLLYRELDSDQLYTLAGVPDSQEWLQLDAATHAFLCLCSHVFFQVQTKPEPVRNGEEEQPEAALAASSDSAIASPADSSSSARKKRRVDLELTYSPSYMWSQYSAAAGLSSSKLVSWLRFLYVFLYQYPAFFHLHANIGSDPSSSSPPLLSQLLQGLMRASERSKTEVKLWSLACISRLASVCHLNQIRLTHPPTSSLLLSFHMQQREAVTKAYASASSLFAQVGDLLLRKHLFDDDRKGLPRCALSLLTKLAAYDLLSPSQLPSHLRTIFEELPALKLTSGSGGGGKLSAQLMIKKEPLHSPQPKPTPAFFGSHRPARGSTPIKLEDKLSGEGGESYSPSYSLISSECDLVMLRFLIAYLQRFDMASESAAAVAASSMANVSPSFSASSVSPHLSMPRLQHGRSQGTGTEALTEEDLLRWILSFRFGSPTFTPAHHSLRSMWSTSQWFATAIAALNHLPLCPGQSGLCLEDEYAEEVRLPLPHSRFVHAQRPQHTWLKADLENAVNVHHPAELRDYFLEAQFVPLVAARTTEEEVKVHALPSISCQQHGCKHSDDPSRSTPSPASSSRSSHLRLHTFSILSEHLQALHRTLRDRAGRIDVESTATGGIGSSGRKRPRVPTAANDEQEHKSKQESASPRSDNDLDGVKVEDVQFAIRLYAHYIQIMCSLVQKEESGQEQGEQAAPAKGEFRSHFLSLLAICFKQLSVLLPHLMQRIDSWPSANLLAYLRQLLSYFRSVFLSPQPGSNGGVHQLAAYLQPSFTSFHSSLLTVLLHTLHRLKHSSTGGPGLRQPSFDDSTKTTTPSQQLYLFSDLHDSNKHSSSNPPAAAPVLDSIIHMSGQLLSWRVLTPVNLLSDLKQYLDEHMSVHGSVRECPSFYRLAHLHALAKSVSHCPHPNQDLFYYLSYLRQEVQRPVEVDDGPIYSKDVLHYRALTFFTDMAKSIMEGSIHLEDETEVDQACQVWESIFPLLQKTPHRFVRLLRGRCAYLGMVSGLIRDWKPIGHLALDIVSADFVVRLFASTQLGRIFEQAEAQTGVYDTFERKIISTLKEDGAASPAGSAAAASTSSDPRESLIMTLLACLAQMGLSVAGKERSILLHMCNLWRERPQARPIITLVYQQLAHCLHYQSRTVSSSSAQQTALLRARTSSLFPPSTSTSLLDDHFDYVLNEWVEAGHRLDSFPRQLLHLQPNTPQEAMVAGVVGVGGYVASNLALDSFLKQYASRIAPLLVLYHDTQQESLELLCQACSMDSPTLLKKYFAPCCARFYAIYAQTVGTNEQTSLFLQTANSCLKFFKDTLTERKFNTYYHSKLGEMLCALVDLVLVEPAGKRLAAYERSNFLVSLTQLAKAEKLEVAQHLCSGQHDRIQTLLMYLRVRLASEFRPFRQWKLFEIVRDLLLTCVSEFLSVPAVWRPAMDLLLWLLPEFDARFPEHAEECVRLLSDVSLKLIEQVAAAPPEPRRARTSSKSQEVGEDGASSSSAAAPPTILPPSEMMLHLRHIITAMIEYSGAHKQGAIQTSGSDSPAPAPGSPNSKIALVGQLILGLIQSLPEHLHGQLTLLPPFPSHPLLSDLNSVFQSLTQERTLVEEIMAFLINVRASSTPKEGAAGLAHLLTQLRTRQTELSQLLQPIPPSLSSLGLEVIQLHPSSGSGSSSSKRSSLGIRSSSVSLLKNGIISVDGKNPSPEPPLPSSSSDSLDVVSDMPTVRVSNRILSSPDHESSGHWGFDLIAPLIGSLCAFCSWSQSESRGEEAATTNARSHAQEIRMLATQCLGEIGAVDSYALNGHNSRVFRNANPLPPIGRRMQEGSGAGVHPFAAALQSAPSSHSSSSSAAAQLHASWYGRWYAVGGGLQAGSCEHLELKREPQAYSNHPHHVLILYLLNNYCRSANAHLAQMAAHTITNLFCTDVPDLAQLLSSQELMLSAFKQLDGLTQSYLQQFHLSKLRPFRLQVRPRSKEKEEQESEVWDVNGKSFDDWICRLSRFLLSKRVKDPVLMHCVGLAAHLPDFATKLFPYVLFDIMQQQEEAVQQMMALRVNALVKSVLAAPIHSMASPPMSLAGAPPAAASSSSSSSSSSLSSTSHAVLQVLLSALQYVREQCLIIHRQSMPLASRSHPTPVRAGVPMVKSIEQNWEDRLELLQLAQAAQTGGMYTTSLIFIEQWHVRTYGRLNCTSAQDETEFKEALLARKQNQPITLFPSPRDSPDLSTVGAGRSDGGEVKRTENEQYHQLLLEVCRNVSDPDMVYGALHSRDRMDDVHSQLMLSEHEGDYTKAMQIYDSICRHSQARGSGDEWMMDFSAASAVDASSSSPFASSSSSSLSSTTIHSGLTRSLQRLGCTHLLDRYMHDLANRDPPAYESIQDVHFEAAWRTAQWDMQPQIMQGGATSLPSANSSLLADSSPNVGLHTCLFRSLKSLHGLSHHQKHVASFTSALTQARHRLVEELARAGPETTQHVFPPIVHLHLLADLERAWNIMEEASSASVDFSDSMDLGDSVTSFSSLTSSHIESRFRSFERLGRDRLVLLFNDSFDHVEPILALRGVILQLAQQNSVLAAHLRFVATFARQSNRRVVGAHAIREGAANPNISLVNKLALKLEEAQLNWTEGLADSAIRSAKHVVMALNQLRGVRHNNHSASSTVVTAASSVSASSELEVSKLLLDASCLVAEWLSKSRSETSQAVQKYLSAAENIASNHTPEGKFKAQQHHKVYYQLACFQDRLFQSLHLKSVSPEHEAARRMFRSTDEKIKQLHASMQEPSVKALLANRDSSDEKVKTARQLLQSKMHYIRRIEKEHAVDAQQNSQFDKSLAHALEQAVLNYCKCLQLGDRYDQVVYRLIALWFNHYAAAPYTAEKLHVVSHVNDIPSRKFLPLVYQIASRLSLSDEPGIPPEQKHFRMAVRDLIRRMAVDHPHHSLYQIFALAHGDQVARVSQSVAGGVEMNQQRIRAAGGLISDLKRAGKLSELVSAQEKLILAYIGLGNMKFSKSIDHVNFSATPLSTLRLRDLALVPVPTLTLPVRADCNYATSKSVDGSSSSLDSPIVTISSFDRHIYLATSGVNVPLILEMLCSDGRRHKQLVKSADDLRQDAVMEQLFKLVNQLLQENRATVQRQLHIRTYNVVPLTVGVGLVEWVLNTTSLAHCLVIETTGVHARHRRPGQKRDYRQCLSYLREAHEKRDSDEFARRFHEVCADFQPVFHRFFLEQYPSPSEWLARRSAYTRSVAVTSIVGFVVGLGDRHIHNILLDSHTAELIHIDLGVAFDMGIVLKTPEIVPFRLTRDMVDGMGVTGVEGTFRKGAEETMRLMRENRETLLTVLEVFLVDPLYKWALSPKKIQQLRPLSEEEEVAVLSEGEQQSTAAGKDVDSAQNSGAARAMFNVRQRLSGVAHKDTLSVEGQVNALIHEATDMERLAKLYYGWSAFV